MNSPRRSATIAFGLGLLGYCGLAIPGQDNSWFFRVVSDQPTQILSISRPPDHFHSFAVLTWSNSVADSSARVDIKFGLHGNWHTNASIRVLETDGHVVTASASLNYVPGEIIVGFNDSVTVQEATELLESYGLAERTVRALPWMPNVLAEVRVPVDSEIQWGNRMITNSIVRSAHPNYILSAGTE